MSKRLNTRLNPEVVRLKIAALLNVPPFVSLITTIVRINWGILFLDRDVIKLW